MKYTIKKVQEDNTIPWNKMTLRELAEKVGCHYSMLSKVRSGTENASEELYLKIKEAFTE